MIKGETSKEGYTDLHFAVDYGKFDLVKELVHEGKYDLEARDVRWGNTALFRAVFCGHDNIVKFLLESKADPNTSNKDHVSAIYQASSMGRHIIIRLLFHARADPEAVSITGQTSLHGACLNNHTQSIKILLEEFHVNPNKVTNSGASALYIATERNNIEAIKLLVTKKADIDCVSPDSISPLMRAAYKGNFDAVKTLVELGANVWLTGTGQTSAAWATREGHNEIAQYLLVEMTRQQLQQKEQEESTINPNPNSDSNSDLNSDSHPNSDLSTRQEQEREQDKRLSKPGFNLIATDPEGFTLIHRAAESGNVELVEKLISLKADIQARDLIWQNTPLFRAVLANKPKVVDVLIKAKAQVDACNINLVSPLYQSCAFGNVEMIQLLIDANANVEHKSSFCQRPLHAACLNGKTQAVKLLLLSKVDMEAVTNSGVGALYMAAERGHVEIIKILTDANANVNSSGPNGITPLMRAAYRNQLSAVKCLLKCKADKNIRALNKTAEEWASQKGNTDIVTLLQGKILDEKLSSRIIPLLGVFLKSLGLEELHNGMKCEGINVELLLTIDVTQIGQALKWSASQLAKMIQGINQVKNRFNTPSGYYLINAGLEVLQSTDDVSIRLNVIEHACQVAINIATLAGDKPTISGGFAKPRVPTYPKHKFHEHTTCDLLTWLGYKKPVTIINNMLESTSSSWENLLATSQMDHLQTIVHCLRDNIKYHLSTQQSTSAASGLTSASTSAFAAKESQLILEMDKMALGPTTNVIGFGSHAKVILVKCKINQVDPMINSTSTAEREYAFKTTSANGNKKREQETILRNEINIWARIPSHPNISKLVAVIRETPTQDNINQRGEIIGTLSEYHALGSLDRLKLFTIHQDDMCAGLVGLVKAIHHLHIHGIIHRDIATRNVLVTVKKAFILTDFGLAKIGSSYPVIDERLPWKILAPEILKARRELRSSLVKDKEQQQQQPDKNSYFTTKSDIYALGILIWELCNASEVWSDYTEDIQKLQCSIETGEIMLPFKSTILKYPKLAAAMMACLHCDPDQRATAREVLALLGCTDI